VQALDEAALERRLLVAPEQPRDHVQPDYGRLHQELRRKGMTLMLLWDADVQTYSYSLFCEYYRRFAKQLKRSMRQVHRAGEKLFINVGEPADAIVTALRNNAERLNKPQLEKRGCKDSEPRVKTKIWWASRESNTAPTDYESAALTKHELEARNRCGGRCRHLATVRHRSGTKWREDIAFALKPSSLSFLPGSSSACRSAMGGAACAAPSLRSGGSARA
jgi:hypothetical protein